MIPIRSHVRDFGSCAELFSAIRIQENVAVENSNIAIDVKQKNHVTY